MTDIDTGITGIDIMILVAITDIIIMTIVVMTIDGIAIENIIDTMTTGIDMKDIKRKLCIIGIFIILL